MLHFVEYIVCYKKSKVGSEDGAECKLTVKHVHKEFKDIHSPKSEHCTTLRLQWHPNGHVGCSAWKISWKVDPSSSSFIIIIKLSTSTVLPRSGRPLCWKGKTMEGTGDGVTYTTRNRTNMGCMTGPLVWICLWCWRCKNNTRMRKKGVYIFTLIWISCFFLTNIWAI